MCKRKVTHNHNHRQNNNTDKANVYRRLFLELRFHVPLPSASARAKISLHVCRKYSRVPVSPDILARAQGVSMRSSICLRDTITSSRSESYVGPGVRVAMDSELYEGSAVPCTLMWRSCVHLLRLCKLPGCSSTLMQSTQEHPLGENTTKLLLFKFVKRVRWYEVRRRFFGLDFLEWREGQVVGGGWVPGGWAVTRASGLSEASVGAMSKK